MIVLLMVLTMAATIGFFWVLLRFLRTITARLESVGTGDKSALGQINNSVIGVEGHTSFIRPEVTKINNGLKSAKGGLEAIDGGLVAIAGAALAQERYR